MVADADNALSPFHVLNTYLTFPNNYQSQWWTKTGPLLSKMLSSSGYTLEQQYTYLTFFQNQLIPRLGPYPTAWHSTITVSGLPVEFSVNYQAKGGHPTVRICTEPANSFSGTEKDPFNQGPPAEMLSHLSRSGLKGFDPTLFAYFTPRHTLSREEQNKLPTAVPGGAKIKTQHAFGFDLKDSGVVVKGYSYPGLKAHLADPGNEKGKDIKTQLTEEVTDLQRSGVMDAVKPWTVISEYMTECSGWGFHNLWAWDYITPSSSRLKFYSFVMDVPDKTKLAELWTCGGRANSPAHQEGLKHLTALWDIIDLKNCGKRDLPKDAHQVPEGVAPMLWNYEMVPGHDLPIAKPYFPLQGLNDAVCVGKIQRYFELLGWKELAAEFPRTVQGYFPDSDLAKTTNRVFWISFTYSEKTGVYLSVYYHPCPE
ncbi:aromatic prenyltransferase [Aspergillus undulatus]|uniref:aromatic prenyltransferase n=1 Tax=Aspergillus undulatus TaxID=1810928 RepID=UPI003CCE3415